MSTLYDDLLDLLDLVGRRDCIHYCQIGPYGSTPPCGDDACEPCAARELFARMVEARDRVA